MVYKFFSRWKEIKSDVFDIEKEIKTAEKLYRLKVRLFKRILDSLEREKIDFKSARKLIALYEKYPNEYQKIISRLKYISSKDIPDREIDAFYELVSYLRDEQNSQKELAEKILVDLVEKQKFPESSDLYKIRNFLKTEGDYLMQQGQRFKKIEEVFLITKEPGIKTGRYMHIFDAIKTGVIKYDNNQLWFEGKPVQGVEIKHNKIRIKGDHYTTFQNAKWIQGDQYVKPSLSDPYSYFVERGKLSGLDSRDIKKVLGAENADAIVSLEIEIFPEQLFVRAVSGDPIKFAVNSLMPQQVIRVYKEAALVS